MLGMGIEEIRRLSQEEGYSDPEISKLLGLHRTTVTRARKRNNIPKAVIRNRKDKSLHCTKCKRIFIVRRCERAYRCPDCVNL